MSPKFLRKFAFRKLVANRKPDCIYKTNFHCSPWAETSLSLPKYVLCRPTKTAEAAFQMFSFIPKILFTAVLLMQNCKRTVNQVMSVNPNFSCPPFLALPEGLALWNPQERFNASLPAANLERTANQIKSVRPSLSRPPSPKNPGLVLRRGCFDPMFLCAFAQQTRVADDYCTFQTAPRDKKTHGEQVPVRSV